MTETTQPDPQVVTWMREYRNPRDEAEKVDVIASAARGWLSVHGYGSLADSPYSMEDFRAAYRAAHPPLTVADIPAGQGPASLYVKRGEDGHRALFFKPDDAEPVLVMWETMPDPAMDALWEHLVATLPHVTTEEDA